MKKLSIGDSIFEEKSGERCIIKEFFTNYDGSIEYVAEAINSGAKYNFSNKELLGNGLAFFVSRCPSSRIEELDPSEEYYSEVGSSEKEFESMVVNFEERKVKMSFDELIENVKMWAASKGIHTPECSQGQIFKIYEEVTEAASAWNNKDQKALIDGIGDSFVTLIIFAMQQNLKHNLNPTDCLFAAWEEIKGRTGKKVNGVFVKD